MTPEQRSQILELAAKRRNLSDVLYRPDRLSGADAGYAELYRLEANALGRIASGGDLEAVLTALDREWREFAIQNNRRVESAPKIRTGPSVGHSVIGHKYTDPGRVDGSVIFIRNYCISIIEPVKEKRVFRTIRKKINEV